MSLDGCRKLPFEIEEYKYWRGLGKTCWAGLNLLGAEFEDAWSLLEYLQGNNPDAILRVRKQE